jgi:hypothetical protein
MDAKPPAGFRDNFSPLDKVPAASYRYYKRRHKVLLIDPRVGWCYELIRGGLKRVGK